jgi:N-sulfoglucosamine sulfohydrolase
MPKRPNFLWISLEDTSPRFGCYGDAVARTPNIDALAAGGVRYPNAFSTAGVCAPSRATIITGMYHTSIGAHHMRTSHTNPDAPELPTPYECVPPPYVKLIPEYLRAAGYYCSNNKKTDYQFEPPVTAWDDCSDTGHWRNRVDGQPFFAVFNPHVTHESGMWPKDGEHITTDPDAVELPPYLPDTLKARLALARHYDNLATADARVGGLLEQLDEDGLADSTTVILWSDHGEGLPRGKRWPYDAGIRIPLIVRQPGAENAGGTCDDLVSLIDLGPTLLSMASLDLPRHFQGRPFLGPEARPREYVFAARDRHDEAYDRVRAVRDRRYKYIRHYHPELPYLAWISYRNRHPIMQELWRLHAAGDLREPQDSLFKPRPPEELYDTEDDRFELTNLASDPAHRETLDRLRGELAAWQNRHGDLGEIPEDQMVARWRPNGVQPRTAAPGMVPINAGHTGEDMARPDANESSRTFEAPFLIQLHCATQGASIAWTIESDDAPRWILYSEPLRLETGETTLRAKAIRIGYVESEERAMTFNVTG